MKRRTKVAKALAVKREAKAAGMKCPGGASRYAMKRSGWITPGPAQSRASWFVRHGIQAFTDAAAGQERQQRQRREGERERRRRPPGRKVA